MTIGHIASSLRNNDCIVRYLFGLSIIFFGIFILPSSLVGYESSVNFICNSLLEKVTQSSFYSPRALLLYDFILLKLYGNFSLINWYLILKFALLSLSYTAFFFVISRKVSLVWFGIFTSICFLFISVFQHHVHVTYLLCVSGVFLNYKSSEITNAPKRIFFLGLSIVSYFLGFCLRWEIGVLSVVLYSIVLLFNLNLRKILCSLTLSIPTFLIVLSINLYFIHSTQFENRIEPDGEFLFLDGGYQPEQMNSLEDSIKYEMLTSWIINDTVILSFNDLLQALEVARKSHPSYFESNKIYQNISDAIRNYTFLVVMIFLCCAALLIKEGVKKIGLILLLLGSLFIGTDVLDERHLFGNFLFLFLLVFSRGFQKEFTQKLIVLLIFFVSIVYIYEAVKVQREIKAEKDIVMNRMKVMVKSGKVLYLPMLRTEFFTDRLTFGSDILGFSSDSIVLLSLGPMSHSAFFTEYLNIYCDKDLLNIGSVYRCVAENKNNVLIVSENTIPIIKKIVNRYYKLDIKFNNLGVLCGTSDENYNFKHFKEPIQIYHLEFN